MSFYAHTTVSSTQVSPLPVLVCGTPCRHIDKTWSIDIQRRHRKDTRLGRNSRPRRGLRTLFKSSLTYLNTDSIWRKLEIQARKPNERKREIFPSSLGWNVGYAIVAEHATVQQSWQFVAWWRCECNGTAVSELCREPRGGVVRLEAIRLSSHTSVWQTEV